MDKLYIIVPAYNESENIKRLIEEWYPIIEKNNGNNESRLIIINDGSKDNTYEIAKEEMKNKPLLEVITKQNGGHGSAVLYGYNYAINNKADYIFQTDSDGQTNPDEFEAFWQLRNEYDAVIGSRPKRQDGLSRKFVEKVLVTILKVIFGVSIPDSNAPFRLMKRELVEKYIDRMPDDFNIPNVMFTTFFVYYQERIVFKEVSFKPRQCGKNSINIKKIVKIGIKAIKDFRYFKKSIKYKTKNNNEII